MDIGQKLKECRTAAGLSQESLAQQLGVTRQTVSSWENNRSYPDIGSIIKLSDLYGLSLDELLKEDTAMREHVEQTGTLPRKYWNRLFEAAILLLPFGALAAYWGAPWVGLTLQLVGLFMLPPLWVARYKLFGMPKEDMKTSLIGWGLYLTGSLVRLLGTGVGIIGNIMAIIGLMMIYGNGVYLERSTRFWLVIALYIGIPMYIWGSGHMHQFKEMGYFSEAQPFGSDYRIVEVDHGTQPEGSPAIALDQFGNVLRIDGVRVGEFTYIKPREDQDSKGIWQLVPKDEANSLYKLEVSDQDETTLAYFVDDQLQWRWKIARIPRVHFMIHSDSSNVAYQMDWNPENGWSGDPDELRQYHKLTDIGNISIQFHDEAVTEFTITEEYHCDGQVQTREYHLQEDKNDLFPLPETLSSRSAGEGQYAVYSIDWEGGTYLFRLDFA